MRREGASPAELRTPGRDYHASPQSQSFLLSRVWPGLPPPSLPCHLDTHSPPWHLLIHEAGSEGQMTVPDAGAQAPSHGVAQRGTSRQAAFRFTALPVSRGQETQKAPMSHFLVFPLVVPSALVPTLPVRPPSALAAPPAHSQTSWRAFLVCLLEST